ncbi:hypothetical protein RND81_05G196700 [Saponaria officinalis]|uniref:Uncharacterized protein n=1 Tax=Saponaria officinalis TaxID=3572 RepID=A0AAW1KZK6_SAPOF
MINVHNHLLLQKHPIQLKMTTFTIFLPQFQTLAFSPCNSIPINSPKSSLIPRLNNLLKKSPIQLSFPVSRSQFSGNSLTDEADSDSTVEILRVPDDWFEPSAALQESEWLRVALHKWLDDEYCPEPTNVDISRVAAESYYRSLLQKTADLGEILLKMIRELESLSYQESFHGPFSSANAAVSLIAQRMGQD